MYANPLTYGQATFTWVMTGQSRRVLAQEAFPIELAPILMVVLTAAIVMLAARIVSKPRKDGLP